VPVSQREANTFLWPLRPASAGPAPGFVTAAAARGSERFTQRQVSRVRPGDYTKADHLETVATWMHATGVAAYDPGAHAQRT
jgi:hypothetical protein